MDASTEQEQIYPFRLGTLLGRAFALGMMTLVSALVTYSCFVLEPSVGAGIFMGFVTLGLFVLFLEPLMKMPRSKRLAVAISHHGLRVPEAETTVAWADVEVILLMCFHLHEARNADVIRAVGGNTNHIRVMRRGGEPWVFTGPTARAIHFGYETELAGGTVAYIQLARELKEWGAAKGVRVAIHAPANDPMVAAVGNPPIADWAELYLGKVDGE